MPYELLVPEAANDINTNKSSTPDVICTNDMISHADLQNFWMPRFTLEFVEREGKIFI
jgi:hypothetical protein